MSIKLFIARFNCRFGHTLVHHSIANVSLVNTFMRPGLILEEETRPTQLLKNMSSSASQAPDEYLIDTLTNHLFADMNDNMIQRPGLDLMALNIMV